MSKIINTKTKEVIYSKEGCTIHTTVTNFIEPRIDVIVYEHLSDLIRNMVGYAMIKHRQAISTATKETVVIQLLELDQLFVLPHDYKNDTNGWNKILQSVFPEYSVIA